MIPTMPSFRLENRRAMVTGAGRGIGPAGAAALAQAGAHVTLVARTRAQLHCVADEIQSAGGSADIAPFDVTDLEAMQRYVEETEPFDILVNNAGMNRPAAFLDVAPSDFDAVLNLNVRAAFFVAQAVSRKLVAAGRPGSIINISSQMGLVGGERRSVYCASKWAMEGFSRAMALDLAANGIRVNTICPTFMETPMTKSFFEDEAFRTSVLSKIKLGRLGTPADLMGAIVFLTSEASSLMTGSSLVVDGGWTAD